MPQPTDWQTLIYDKTEYEVLHAIMAAIESGAVEDGLAGLEEMIQLMGKREVRELESRLAVLMAHVLKFKTQPPGSKSWRRTIEVQRAELESLRRDAPRFTRDYILTQVWPQALRRARLMAEGDTNQPLTTEDPTWDEVFETPWDERE